MNFAPGALKALGVPHIPGISSAMRTKTKISVQKGEDAGVCAE